MVDDSLEAQIIELRKSDQFCRMSISEIIRTLIKRGLEEQET